MSARVIVSGVIAGMILFAWGFFADRVVPLGEVGIKSLSADKQEKVSAVLAEQISESGLYFMPGRDTSLEGDAATAEIARWTKACEAGPTAFMVFHPTGKTPLSTTDLVFQAILDMLIGLTAATIVSYFRRTGFLCRIALVMSFGFLAFLQTDAAYFNGYRFPLDFTAVRLADKLGGMLLAGIVLATFIRLPGNDDTTKSRSA